MKPAQRFNYALAGFTIIELLVVIAIIGILTTVVLTSLNDARQSGVSAKIKSELVTLGKRADIEKSKELTYDVVCGSNGITQASGIISIVEAIEQFSAETVVCNSNTDSYAASAALDPVTYWCVDSTGFSNFIPAALTTELVCS